MPNFARHDSFVELSSAHISERDGELLTASSKRDSDGPVTVWANGEYGWFLYVPDEDFRPYMDDEYNARWDFSDEFHDLMKDLRADAVDYVLLDRDGAVFSCYPTFER